MIDVVLTKYDRDSNKPVKKVDGVILGKIAQNKPLRVFFADNELSYVTSHVVRALELVGDRTVWVQTENSTYTLRAK